MKKIKKILKRFFQGLILLFASSVIVLYATGNQYIFRAIKFTYLQGKVTAHIDDYVNFETRLIKNSEPQLWEYHENYNKVPFTNTLLSKLEKLESAGFLIVKDGKILHEKYFNNYSDTSLTNSFSVSKTFVTMLLGKTIEEGYIKSMEQSIVDFLPEFKNDSLANLCTIGDLSAMTAGYDWKEKYYMPLNATTKAYFGRNINEQILGYKFTSISGEKFQYKSGSTQLLGIIISRATGKNLSEYLSEKFWKPMGMEKSAPWSLDNEDGMEKAYCCVSARLRDFAKFGQLLLQNGKWNGKQLLDSAFVYKMVHPNTINGKISNPIYGYGLWTDYNYSPKIYSLVGHLGQKVICIPSKNMVIVRTGNKKENKASKTTIPGSETDIWVDEALKMVKE